MSDRAHVRPGDDLRDTLPAAGFEGDFLMYVDPVSEGPVPADGDLLEIRARYLAEVDDLPLDEVRGRLAAERDLPGRFGGYATVTLWFEQDWFCHAILVRLLAAVPDHPDLRLMSTDRFPGVEPFYGFGQLDAAQLATFAGHDAPVTAAQRALGARAWDALRAPTPVPLQEVVDDADPALPYLAGAVRRHLQEYPWRADGLSLTERLCLASLAPGPSVGAKPARGMAAVPGDLPAVFTNVQAADPAPFQGDTQVGRVLDRLATAERPALSVSDGVFTLTPYGADLLAGRARWVTAPRWLGGRLVNGATWVYDDVAERVSAG
jgi:hypothetical protein